MATNVIHPIPLTMRSKPMAEQIYRMASFVGPISTVVCYVWYIEGPKQKIIVDSGFGGEAMAKSGLTGFKDIQTLEEGLAKYGLKPSDIDLVIQTHLHIDHILYATSFTKARFLVQQAEIDYQRNPPPPAVDPRPCSKELLDTLKWEVVKGDAQVAEGVKVLFTPGHTGGNQSVAVETAKGLAVIDGLCTTDENWNVPAALQARMPVLVPFIHTDPVVAYESLLKIKKVADIKVPIHEPRYAFINKIPA